MCASAQTELAVRSSVRRVRNQPQDAEADG
jgi:hypothetical protein